MADLTITECTPVVVWEQLSGLANAEIDAGEAVYIVAASGKFDLADEDGTAPADDPIGVSITDASAANERMTVVMRGILDVGDALDGMDYGDPVYLAADPGELADDGGANNVLVGEVVPGWGATTADKLLRLEL